MKRRYWIVLLQLVALQLLGSFAIAQQLEFSQRKDIKSIGFAQPSVSSGPCEQRRIVHFSIATQELQWHRSGGYDDLSLPGAKVSGSAGEPSTHTLSQRVVFGEGAVVCGVVIRTGEYVEIENPILPEPRIKPPVWSPGAGGKGKAERNEAIYRTDALFPGRAADYISGSNGEETEVYVQLYPIQYNPVTRKAYLVVDADLEILYMIQPASASSASTTTIGTDAENIIITSEDFLEGANILKTLHETREQISTKVVTTQWIDEHYQEAPDPTYTGYATESETSVKPSYKYSLAKKIISYLRDTQAHTRLKNITILGDSKIVPPSYYFYCGPFSGPYDDWICSDLLYASPDYDYVLNYAVGRLPAANAAEAVLMANKLVNWRNNLSESWFYNVSLVGGNPFQSEFFHGEVITLDSVNEGYLKGMNISKHFWSNQSETRESVLPLFSDGNTGFIYHIGHGSGDTLYLGLADRISVKKVKGLDEKDQYPVVVSIACENGGYDAELMKECSFGESFAEGVLRSKAGGIAYWGGVRLNYGAPDITVRPNGRMIVGKEEYMSAMLTQVFQAYSSGENTFGAIHTAAISKYATSLNQRDIIDMITFYEFVFLGDPALSLLPQRAESGCQLPRMYVEPAISNGGYTFSGEPSYSCTSTKCIPMEFSAVTDSDRINVKIAKIENSYEFHIRDTIVDTLNTKPFVYTYEPDEKPLFYMVSYETSDYKESRVLFYVRQMEGDNLPPIGSRLSVQMQGERTYDMTWTPSGDYDGSLVSYVLSEYGNPGWMVDGCKGFSRWNADGFVLDSNGHESASCFATKADAGEANVASVLPLEIKEGERLSFWYRFDRKVFSAMVEVYFVDQDGRASLLDYLWPGGTTRWQRARFDLTGLAGESGRIAIFYYALGRNKPRFFIDTISLSSGFDSVKHLTIDPSQTTYRVSDSPIGNYCYTVKATDDGKGSSPLSNAVCVEIK